MSIQVLEAMTIHEPLVLLRNRGSRTGFHRFAHHLIYFFFAVCRQCQYNFSSFGGVSDFFSDKAFKKLFHQQHHKDILTYYHAGGVLISELRIESESKLCKEFNCPV